MKKICVIQNDLVSTTKNKSNEKDLSEAIKNLLWIDLKILVIWYLILLR